MVRLRIITIVLTISFIIVWIRLFYWQVLSYDSLKDLANNQYFYRLEIPPSRGEILASDYSPIVTNQTAYLLFVEKKYIEDIDDYVEKLAPILEVEEASVSSALASNDVWAPIKHQVEQEKIDKVKALKLKGVGFEREDKRYYPESSMAAHLLGFVGKDELGKPKGYFGLEGYYNKELSGQPGFLLQEQDAFGDPIVIGKIDRIDPKHGRNLVLYLDKTVQFIAETKLKSAIDRFEAKGGTVTIMDPRNGGILALASYPNYDPASFPDFPSQYYKNPVIADTYEPGSTFKPLLMALAIDEGKVNPTDTYDESGPITVSGYQINTATNKYHGTISMAEILQYSSNVGMVYITNKIGKESILSFLEKYGLGDKTNIDLQEEANTAMRAKSDWREIDLATVSFGQGIAVTRIQMLRSIAAIANNGVLMEPRIVKEILSEDGKIIKIPPAESNRLYSSKTTKVVTQFMVNTVENGPSYWKKPDQFSIAGKTGTAQVAIEGNYDKEKTIASFVGFAPAYDPQFVMLVTINEPTASPWGSSTAAPVFFEIADELFPYFGINPN